MSKRETLIERYQREASELRTSLFDARATIQALNAALDAARPTTLTQRIALSGGVATITHPVSMTAGDVERLRLLVALLEPDDEQRSGAEGGE